MKMIINLVQDFYPVHNKENNGIFRELHWRADISGFPLVLPPVGHAKTKEEAVANLFVNLLKNYRDDEVFDQITGVDVFETVLEKSAQFPTPKFVVPEYVVQCINELDFADMNIDTATGMSRALTMTIDENHRGIFTYDPNTVLFFSPDKIEVKVDFSDIPLSILGESFRAALIKRCQRVGQAILDAQNKPKPIDPDEGLPEITEGLFDGLKVNDNGLVVGKLGPQWGMFASRHFTGTDFEDEEGVFQEEGGHVEFQIYVYKGNKINALLFTVIFPCNLTTENLATAIPERIRLVRAARAKALQEAGFVG